MIVEFARAGWIDRARQNPDRVRMVLEKVRAEGLPSTVGAVLNRLDQALPLGYCNVGIAMDVGRQVGGISIGERIASNGYHAEVVSVPKNLCAKIPDTVSDDEAAFTVIGSIALQGIRLLQPTLGEAVVVTGLGLIGLVAVQLLRANGCRVLGIDLSVERLALARRFGAETVDLSAGQDPVAAAQTFSRGRGVDAVLITATTNKNDLVHQAALMCRKRGRIVLVGVAGLELSRADFYEKELSFQVSCSYGPGRYDPKYEELGQDYPVGFVRWTEQRNFEAVLDMMADGRLNVEPLISHRFAIDEAEEAYDLLSGTQPSLGILLEYSSTESKHEEELQRATVTLAPPTTTMGTTVVAFVGAGNYAAAKLMPAFKKTGARLKVVASRGGISGAHAGRKFGFETMTTDIDSVFDDPEVEVVVIATRHDSHGRLACQALRAGKHVFVEKPLALTVDELTEIERAYLETKAAGGNPLVMVGFNRRFAPHVRRMKDLLASMGEAKALVMTVNAGAIPDDHWLQDLEVGGGRIVGEACHFVDLLRYLTGVPIIHHSVSFMGAPPGDTCTIQFGFEDGSIGSIHYFANGNRRFPKERLEVFCGERILRLDNFRKLTGYGWPRFRKMSNWRQDKGQQDCVAAFVHAVEQRGKALIEFGELMEVSRAAIEIAVVRR